MRAISTKFVGALSAFILIGSWLFHLIILLSTNFSEVSLFAGCKEILLQAFLQTGLFVTAHDAIHGLALPAYPSINKKVGQLCLAFYGLLSYKLVSANHHLHHRYPASLVDPDYLDIEDAGFMSCYLSFLGQYWGGRQLLWLGGGMIVLVYFYHVAPINIGLFWVLPLLLSSVQLFYFGTYHPHQKGLRSPTSFSCAPSRRLPWLLSFIACYHFCYHEEHHRYPETPWWQLPNTYCQTRSA